MSSPPRRLPEGVAVDTAGCPAFDKATSRDPRPLEPHRRRAGPEPAGRLDTSVPGHLDRHQGVTKGGKFLAVWADTAGPAGRIDRMGRPLTGNALLATLGPAGR